MSFKEILDYQRIDFDVYKQEREVYQSDEIKRGYKLQALFKERKELVPVMDKELADMMAVINGADERIKALEDRKKDLVIDFDTFDTIEQFDEYEKIMSKYDEDVTALSRDTGRAVKRMYEIGVEFKKLTEQLINIAKENNYLRSKLETMTAKVKDATKAQRAELASLSEKIDPKLLSKYKELRKAKKMPAVVEHNKEAHACSVCCHDVDLDGKEYVICSNCGRIVFDGDKIGG